MKKTCQQCAGVSAAVEIAMPRQYLELVQQLRQMVDEGALTLLRGPGLDTIKIEGQPWRSDTMEHELQCPACGRRFMLFVDTYHGGGHWRPA